MSLGEVDPELLAFCEPWLAREPRLLLGCRYAEPGTPRARVLAAQVLLREFAQAAIAASDRRVAEARLHWWIEEAAYWRQGHARHPLANGLDPLAAAAALAQTATLCLEWLEAAPDDLAALRARLHGLAAAGAAIGAGASPTAWLAAAVRQSLLARASLASLLPLELCARHGLRRSQWGELDPARRRALLAELAGIAIEPAPARATSGAKARGESAALAALEVLDRRWLDRIGEPDAERLRLREVYAAWRAARAAAAA